MHLLGVCSSLWFLSPYFYLLTAAGFACGLAAAAGPVSVSLSALLVALSVGSAGGYCVTKLHRLG